MTCGIGEVEPLSVCLDNAVLAHAFACGVENGRLYDIIDGQLRPQVAVLVAHVTVFAACNDE